MDVLKVHSNILVDGQVENQNEIWLAKITDLYPDTDEVGIIWYDAKRNQRDEIISYTLLDDRNKVSICLFLTYLAAHPKGYHP